AAHAVIAGAEAATNEDRYLGHAGGRDGGDELGAVLGDALSLILPADHEPGDVLQEQERRPALAGELDEVRSFDRAFAEQHTIVGEDCDGHAPDVREAADERRSELRLELVELAAVDEARDDLVDVVGRADVLRDDAVELLRIEQRIARLAKLQPRPAPRLKGRDDVAHDGQRMLIVFGEMVDDAALLRV